MSSFKFSSFFTTTAGFVTALLIWEVVSGVLCTNL